MVKSWLKGFLVLLLLTYSFAYSYPLNKDALSAVALIISVDIKRGTVIQGTGFNIKPNGYIVTSFHVVLHSYIDPKNPILVIFKDSAYFSRIICADDIMDIAILKINAENMPYLKLGNLRNLHEGEEIYVLGYPGRGKLMFSEGKVEKIFPGGKVKFIVTNAPLSYGSSGSPLLNVEGKVVGIASFILIREGKIRSMGIAADNLKELIRYCRIGQ